MDVYALAVFHELLGESLGYPDDVEFVPGDQEWADDVVWRNLAEEAARR